MVVPVVSIHLLFDRFQHPGVVLIQHPDEIHPLDKIASKLIGSRRLADINRFEKFSDNSEIEKLDFRFVTKSTKYFIG